MNSKRRVSITSLFIKMIFEFQEKAHQAMSNRVFFMLYKYVFAY